MNWLFLNPIKKTGWGGMENWMRNLAVGLQAVGDRCVIVARPESPWREACGQSGLAYEPFRFGTELAPWSVRKVRDIARRHRADVAITKGYRSARFLRLADRRIAVGVKLPCPRDLREGWFDRFTYAHAVDRVLVDSYDTRRVFLRFPWVHGEKIVAAHNGVAFDAEYPAPERRDAARRTLGVGADQLVVMVVGRFSDGKRFDDAIEAFAASGVAGRAVLYLMGDGERRVELERRAAACGAKQHIRFLGMRNDTGALLWACNVLLHPIDPEGLPNATLEAMGRGAVAITTDNGANPEVITDGVDGLLVPTGDIPAMAGRLRSVVDDADCRSAIAQAAVRRARTGFPMNRMVETIRNAMADAKRQEPRC